MAKPVHYSEGKVNTSDGSQVPLTAFSTTGWANGTGTITSATSVNVAHGLGLTPTVFNITPTSDLGGDWWATADETNVVLHLTTASSGTFVWTARP